MSSTSTDLLPYRVRARDLLLTFNLRPLEMEYFPAEAATTSAVLDRYLDAADGIVLIAGARYGSMTHGGRSYVEWEFEQAVARGIPVVCLILTDAARRRVNVPTAERERQEQFIDRLKKHSKVSQFDDSNFDLVLGGALQVLPSYFGDESGLVRRSDYNKQAELAALRHHETSRRERFVRLVGGVGLIQRYSMSLGGGNSHMTSAEHDRVLLDKLIDLLYQSLSESPVAAQIIERLLRQQVDRFHGFVGPAGFIPESLAELEASLEELFGESLHALRATSIHSRHEALATYKGYWEDEELGQFFKEKNKQFLSRPGDRLIQRVYVCDSVANSVGEDWFTQTVVEQVGLGAEVKVVQLRVERASEYEDFGIYEHRVNDSNAGDYLLLAPRELNLRRRDLTTSVSANPETATLYRRKFDALWKQSPEPLEVLSSAERDEADRGPLETHGRGSIEDLFGHQIILRRMERLDTGEKLLSASARSVRKYQMPYAVALSDHIKRRYPGVRRLLYVGDTHKNDGGAMRNLQALGWNLDGFVCEPTLRISRLLFNGVVYTDRWTDLVVLAHRTQAKANSEMLALFDIDQTLWAPKGVHEGPLTASRIRAATRLVDDYVTDPESDLSVQAKARIDLLYREVSRHKYLPLTVDNEDFKAVICVSLALNLTFDQSRLESSDREAGAAFFGELGRLDARSFVELMRDKYLPNYLHPAAGSEASITHFIMETLSTAQTYQYSLYGETNGILVARLVEHLRDVFRETVGIAPIQYAAFRAKELEEALSSAGVDGDFREQIVLNKPAWDFARWLRGKDVQLLAISDRPDESTVSPSGDSLLDVSMNLFGKDISGFLP